MIVINYIELNTGQKIHQLGFGVYKCTEEEGYNAIVSALKIGYRHIDTATIYHNEEIVGQAIKDSKIPREDLFITTKLWNTDQRNSSQRKALETSLKKLKLDYVDLYLLHWPVEEKIKESWVELEKIFNEGLSKSIGVSNFLEKHIETIKSFSNIVPAINQIELHPYLTQTSLLNYCNKEGIVVEAWSPLGANKNNLLQNEILKEIASKYNKSTAQIILRWNIEKNIVTIPKSSNPERQKENFNIFDFSLSKEEVQKINNLNTNNRVGQNPNNVDF